MTAGKRSQWCPWGEGGEGERSSEQQGSVTRSGVSSSSCQTSRFPGAQLSPVAFLRAGANTWSRKGGSSTGRREVAVTRAGLQGATLGTATLCF